MKQIALSQIKDEHDAGFLDRISAARAAIHAGYGVKIEDLKIALKKPSKPVARRAGRTKARAR